MSLSLAITLATNAHDGQVDKAGQPYILHPLRVMGMMQTDTERVVAVLHDVLEDTSVTKSELLDLGFSEEVVFAVECLTRREGESYIGFIKRLKSVPLAKRVKIADIKDNMDLTRIQSPTQKDIERNEKYKKALLVLTSET